MKVEVDFDLCESNALCVEAAPDVFEVNDDDQLVVLLPNPPESMRKAVQAAVMVCPKQAIQIVE
jgi:ferredoxin